MKLPLSKDERRGPSFQVKFFSRPIWLRERIAYIRDREFLTDYNLSIVNERASRIMFASQMVPYLPCNDGFRVIPANLIRELSQRHEIHLLAFCDHETAEQLSWSKRYCRSVTIVRSERKKGIRSRVANWRTGIEPTMIRAFRRMLDRSAPHVVHLEGPSVAPLAKFVPSEIPIVLSAHDSLSLRYRDFSRSANSQHFRAESMIRALLAQRFERRWFAASDRIVVTSSFDKAALGRFVSPKQLVVVPNGIDLQYFTYNPKPQVGRIVFSGNMSYFPNVDAAEYFVRESFQPLKKRFPGVEFWIVGADPSPLVKELSRSSHVYVTGTVPDLREWIWSASVFVSPLRVGVGVKNKILETMALGSPIVATSKSLTGTPLNSGVHALVADGPEEIYEAVAMLMDDRALAKSLSLAARAEVESHYTWASVAARFEATYADIVMPKNN
jgi:glycosyltransferase involved in cell wall biosynthesis